MHIKLRIDNIFKTNNRKSRHDVQKINHLYDTDYVIITYNIVVQNCLLFNLYFMYASRLGYQS